MNYGLRRCNQDQKLETYHISSPRNKYGLKLCSRFRFEPQFGHIREELKRLRVRHSTKTRQTIQVNQIKPFVNRDMFDLPRIE